MHDSVHSPFEHSIQFWNLALFALWIYRLNYSKTPKQKGLLRSFTKWIPNVGLLCHLHRKVRNLFQIIFCFKHFWWRTRILKVDSKDTRIFMLQHFIQKWWINNVKVTGQSAKCLNNNMVHTKKRRVLRILVFQIKSKHSDFDFKIVHFRFSNSMAVKSYNFLSNQNLVLLRNLNISIKL